MITDVYIVYNDDCHLDRINDEGIKPFIHLIDERTKNGKKAGRKLRQHWGATELPFVVCCNRNKEEKVFYSESKINVIEALIDYLNEEIKLEE